ncbi:hypothetical protein B0H17DRAFT_1046416 [Mycena rosella]|uniref:Uncharacterized protein n=1 Tax=Mycena rosella TaxID=1033263 RepID=A0AAD7DY56_MYCRO|nr:hypothetical protein B0H17DRAFT_1046416 [Mycena rosella]
MSDHSLPDEIISEILSPALKVSDKVFSDTSKVSPFANYSESTSAYLLVCKSWLRVATPLLYHVVILRSKAQAKALGQALKKNQQLGQFIKKLRVEGGYGVPMGTILEFSPNISDLFISFEIYASDNTGGLCKGFPFINPTRVILRELAYKHLDNKMTLNLANALVQAISKWDRLSVIELPYENFGRPHRAANIAVALAKSRRLRTVVIPVDGVRWAYSLLKDCPLEAIQIKNPISAADLADLSLGDHPELKALLNFTERPPVAKQHFGVISHPLITPSLNPAFIPMNSAPGEVQDMVWTRILYFAMSVPELAENPRERNIPPRLPLLLVSKLFNRLALPHLYTYIHLTESLAPSKLLIVLQNNPSLGPLVRTVCGGFCFNSSDSDSDDSSDVGNTAPETDYMLPILAQMTGLVRFHGSSLSDFDYVYAFIHMELSISWDAFEVMTKASGSTLREFSKRVAECQRVSAATFNHLTQLRFLDWKCETSFDFSLDTLDDALPRLEELRVWSADPSFFAALSVMKLPLLRRVLLSSTVTDFGEFLKTHGSKLTELRVRYWMVKSLAVNIFKICPNLKLITFPVDQMTDSPPSPETFSSPQTICSSLESMQFKIRRWFNDNEYVAKWEVFFAGLQPKHFPNLREIEFSQIEWPTSERDIAKSCWVRWAEDLLKHNINLMDKNGKKWRTRLRK